MRVKITRQISLDKALALPPSRVLSVRGSRVAA
jgi:hypothetical protein